jgi:hypothetical protein
MTMPRPKPELIEILKILKEVGGTDCTGTCHHRKPGEFHCHTMSQMMNISSQGVKNRLLALMRMGLVKRQRIAREDSTLLVRFVLSSEGEAFLKESDLQPGQTP